MRGGPAPPRYPSARPSGPWHDGTDAVSVLRAGPICEPRTEESLQAQFGHLANYVREGCLTGSDEQVLDRIGQYVDAGADQVNIALRAPFDLDAIERLAIALGLTAA